MARRRPWQTSLVKHRLCLACKRSGLARGFCESVSLGFGAWRTPLSGEEFTCPCPWLPKVQPEVEELEPTPSGPGQQVAEKNELGRLQYSLDYDFQTGQVGVETEGSFGPEGAGSSSPLLEEVPEGKLRLGSSHHCPAAGGQRAS